MAGFYQAMAFGLLLTAAGLSLLGSVATGQGDKDVKVHLARKCHKCKYVGLMDHVLRY